MSKPPTPTDTAGTVKSSIQRELLRALVGIRRRTSQILRLQKVTPESDPIQDRLLGELRETVDTLAGAADKTSKSEQRPGIPMDPTVSVEDVMEDLMKGKKQ